MFYYILRYRKLLFHHSFLVMLYFLSVAQQPNSGPGRLNVEVSRSHTIAHPVGLLRTSDRLVVESATYTALNKHKRPTTMPSAGFEPATSEIKRMQTYTLQLTTTGMGYVVILLYYLLSCLARVRYCVVNVSRCDECRCMCVCVCVYCDLLYLFWKLHWIVPT
jgi:hypothetical protein